MMGVVTKNLIQTQLAEVGAGTGNIILVHSSLRSFGYVEGGAETVIDALVELVGDTGTVLVPTLTGTETDSPANPPVFDVLNSPCWTGRIPETFRMRPDAVRSIHPTHSVAAIGHSAVELTRDHIASITPCDEVSPYGKLAERENGYIMLLGVDHTTNTTLHHIEELAGSDYHMQAGLTLATLTMDNTRIQRHYLLHQWDTPRNFNVIDPLLTEREAQRITQIGSARVRLINARQMVQIVLQCLRASPRILCQP